MASGVDARLLKSTKFPPEFNQKVDMQKVNIHVIKKWIASRISEILGNEDDVIIELCFALIEGARNPDIKSLQIQLTGFLEKDTATFCKELWKLLLSAQSSPQGVPKELLEAKKLELMQEKADADRSVDDTRRRRDEDDRRARDFSDIVSGKSTLAQSQYFERQFESGTSQALPEKIQVQIWVPVPVQVAATQTRSTEWNESRRPPTTIAIHIA
ncbi:serine/arginine repetitive matrix protein 1 [Emericellopsis cladophorae]|uniref:Serine/arginine repetitive matrix protein 1 n=1 Tax=Emericellopsis cladophorae TaxID=2686198 RepID=A0A9P9XYX7_9HYPO|nr:serine/arginine repetitive matrix protein 1 [Emericellopsis cladophorae]KAI6780196.1 serine/arginine repetitive matrix protein 1 [Emericellopsis cladophorae]